MFVRKRCKYKERWYKEIFKHGVLKCEKDWSYNVDFNDRSVEEVYYVEFKLEVRNGLFWWRETSIETEKLEKREVAGFREYGNIPERVLDLRYKYEKLSKMND